MTKKNPKWYYDFVNVPFTKREILLLSAAITLREPEPLTRLLKKRVRPVALSIFIEQGDKILEGKKP